MFYDLHTHVIGENAEQLAAMATQLGYSGICVSEYFKGQQKQLQEQFSKIADKTGIRIFLGFEARNQAELARLAEIRKQYDLLLVHGGDLKLNKAACETPGVVLTHPELGRADSGINDVMMRAAARNGVAIEMNFRNILVSDGKTRSKVMANIRQNVMLAKKFHALLLLSSGAVSSWEMRDPLVLMSMAMQLGMQQKEAKDALTVIPEKILSASNERKSKGWVMPGVKIV